VSRTTTREGLAADAGRLQEQGGGVLLRDAPLFVVGSVARGTNGGLWIVPTDAVEKNSSWVTPSKEKGTLGGSRHRLKEAPVERGSGLRALSLKGVES